MEFTLQVLGTKESLMDSEELEEEEDDNREEVEKELDKGMKHLKLKNPFRSSKMVVE